MKHHFRTKLISIIAVFAFLTSVTAYTFFVPNPQTSYAATFVQLCDGQQWFIDEVERLLNIQEKSIDTLTSKNDLNHIVTFGMQGKGISGAVPRALGEFRNLKHIFLGNNELSGGIPKELGNLTKLENIDLSNNNLTGAIPAELGNLSNLKVMLLWNNDLSGAIPSQLGNLSNLTNLDLADNGLSGGIPASLGNLENLEFLSVSNNPLGGTIPTEFEGLTSIRALLMWECGLTGSVPNQLGTLTNMEILDLAHNQLEGAIPTNFGQLTKLQKLSLRDNAMSGTLPTELSALTELQIFDVPENQFTGSIPASYSALTKLEEFFVSNNQLSGSLPSELSALGTLRILDAGHNTLTGSLPESYAQLTALEQFSVGSNQLSGPITDIFTNMENLTTVDLSNNKFVSDVPISLKTRADAGVDVDVRSNYLAGERVATLQKIEDNFVDVDTSMQNVMVFPCHKPDEAPEIYVLPQDETLYFYDAFYTINNQTGEVTNKPKLNPDAYDMVAAVELDDKSSRFYDLLDLIMTDKGWAATTFRYIDQDEPITLHYGITANNGLPNSTAEIKIASQYEVGNRSPVANNVEIAPAQPMDGDTLEVLYDYSDRENDAEGDTIVIWKRPTSDGWEVVSEGTSKTYTVPVGSVGDIYRAEVIVKQADGQTNGFRFWSEPVLISEQQGGITLSVTKANDLITVSGIVTDGSNYVVVNATAPSGQTVYIGAVPVNENAYSVSFRLKQPIEAGTYQVRAKSTNMDAPMTDTFIY